nr:MAG TPA: hypothetical protein [Microviridae sp.]
MEKKERTISVFATSNCGTTIQVTITEEVEDLTGLINKAIGKIKELEKENEKLKIVHIDSIRRQKIPEL